MTTRDGERFGKRAAGINGFHVLIAWPQFITFSKPSHPGSSPFAPGPSSPPVVRRAGPGHASVLRLRSAFQPAPVLSRTSLLVRATIRSRAAPRSAPVDAPSGAGTRTGFGLRWTSDFPPRLSVPILGLLRRTARH